MLHVQCPGCGTSAYLDCLPGCAAVPGEHLAGCPAADIDAAVACPPGSGCCEEDHSHFVAACPTDHSGQPCPHPAGKCPSHKSMQAWAHAEDILPEHLQGDCPGGHHGLGVKGCVVCRPLVITVMPGSTAIQTVGG